MRVIGHLASDVQARTFGDFLYVNGIETEAERDGERWAIWVRSDDDIPQATKLLEEFRANPNDARWQAGSPAQQLREKAAADQQAYQKRFIEGRNVLPGLRTHGFGFVTYALIAASVIVFVVSSMGDNPGRIEKLFIESEDLVRDGGKLAATKGLASVRDGEVWRLVTPIFIHFGIFHILFNMMWLRDLGSLFEARLSSWYFALFVLATGVFSNWLQFIVTKHVMFGGMSGVVYALIGYVWIRGRFDPAAGMMLDKQNLIWALIFFVLCFTNLLGPVANYAHLGGLAMGMTWAFVDSKRS